ncbi:redoxin domain-containing protein [Maribellus comscasis]|uniref:Redoxin domain-containing protein n=1 Tax=Maribellus comscasis TaxID=2681766 RepID=A0A6I6JYP3_9BACT|nr:TlpA disulfide reductase family protein [Maribellus comscasis]QGY46260.1 redoxin domain-containing protein [Maribellus comscasis]
MKKLWILVLGGVIFACTQQKGFEITVDIGGAEGQMLLEQRGTDAWISVDTADVVDGVAVLKGEVERPGDYYLSILGQRNKMLIFVENSKMTVTGAVDSLDNVLVTGSKTHDEYKGIDNQIKELSNEYMALYQQSRESLMQRDTAKAEELMDKVNEIYESANQLQEDFIKNNPGSYVTPYFISNVQYSKDLDELVEMVDALDPKLDSVPGIIRLKERIDKLKTVAVGQVAPDFTQNDPDGNPVRFSDVYSQNELTLLDFWAAWCGPCRAENPNVVSVYNSYKDEGFSVFGVSLDRTKEDWQKAIKDDGLTWQHVSDLSYWQNSAAQLYAVNSIPSSLLVDKNGKIIAKNKRGEELRKVVAEFLE